MALLDRDELNNRLREFDELKARIAQHPRKEDEHYLVCEAHVQQLEGFLKDAHIRVNDIEESQTVVASLTHLKADLAAGGGESEQMAQCEQLLQVARKRLGDAEDKVVSLRALIGHYLAEAMTEFDESMASDRT